MSCESKESGRNSMSCESKESGRNSMSCESKEYTTGAIGIKSFIGCRCSEFNVFDMCDSFAVLVIHDSLVGTDMNHAFRSLAVSLSCRDIRLTG